MIYLKTYEGFNKNSNSFAINLAERIKKVLYVLGLKVKVSHNYKKAGEGKFVLAPVDLDIYQFKVEVNFINNNFGLLTLMTIPYHNFKATDYLLPHFDYKCPLEYFFNIKVSDPFTPETQDKSLNLND